MANEFTEFNGDATALAEAIFAPGSGIIVVPGSATYTGANSAAAFFRDLEQGETRLGSGILLTSGDGTPPLQNTEQG